jgi:opacity protein-like surface antigen
MKFIPVCAAFIVTASASSFSFADTTPSYFDGFHLGAGIETQDLSVHSAPAGLAGPIKANSDGVNAHLAASWDKAIDAKWVVGVEASTDFGGARNLSTAGTNGVMAVKPGAAWALSARGGYLVTPDLLAYLRAGYEQQDLKRTIAFTDTTTSQSDKASGGALLGVGLEKSISDRFGVRAEYDRDDLTHGVSENNLVLSLHYKL